MTYPKKRESILFGGLGAAQVSKRRKKLCASGRLPFAWLRLDVCVEKNAVDDLKVEKVTSSDVASRTFHAAIGFAGRGRESALVLCLDPSNRPIGVAVVGVGGRSTLAIDPVQVFQPAVLVGASHVIFAHNHPSSNTEPSEADIKLTSLLISAGASLQTPLLDSIVLSDDPKNYFSLRDNGMWPDR